MSRDAEDKGPGFFEGFWLLAKYVWYKMRNIDVDVFIMDPNLREAKRIRCEEQYISAPPPRHHTPLPRLRLDDKPRASDDE